MRLFRRLAYLIHRRSREADLLEELAFHRTLAEQEQVSRGLTETEAHYAARRQMGNTLTSLESAHRIWLPAAIEGALQDLRYAWRGLRRSKALLAASCLSLGLSTGFGTALFSVVNAVILQPVTAAHPDRVVSFWVGSGNRVSWLNLRDLCEDTPKVSCVGYREEEVSWQAGSDSVRLFAQAVSPQYFSRLGISAAQGRVFAGDAPGESTDVVVVTHAFWQRQLSSDPQVIGRKLTLSGHPYVVAGVLPQGFRSMWGLGISPSLYLPIGSAIRPASSKRTESQYELLGVLGPAQNLAEFRARMLARAKDLAATYPVENREFGRVQAWVIHQYGLLFKHDEPMMRTLLLFASLLIVLVLLLAVVACTNVAGLLVARALARQREIAVRLSVGCGRMRLARLLLAESLLLALLGIGTGALCSIWLARFLVAIPLPFHVPFEVEVPLDWRLLAYLGVLTGLATLTAGLAPIVQSWRMSPAGVLGHAPQAVGFRRWSVRGVLVTGQVAVSTVLLVTTMLFLRSLWTASQIDPGFDLDHVVTVEIDSTSPRLTETQLAAYQRSALTRLRELPGVESVSGAHIVPLSLESSFHSLQIERGGITQDATVTANWVLPDYFRVMGIPIRTGRDFTEADRQARPHSVVVNDTLARRLFPGQSALGHRVRRPPSRDNEEPWAEIVGVVADSRYLTLGEEIKPLVYWPAGPGAANHMTLHVRTTGNAAALARSLPDLFHAVNRSVPVRSRPLRAVMAVALFPAQAAAVLLAALGLIGLALTVTGLYGVVAYTVARRVPEIGVRIALGATPESVLRLLVRDGLAIAGVGLAVGLGSSALLSPALQMFLAGVSPHDLLSFGLVAVVLLGTALAASYAPARRGSRLMPMEALRSE